MGWNSWDSYGTTVTEVQVKANADVMARDLASYGWQYIVVDIQWYEPNAQGHDYAPGAKLAISAADAFGAPAGAATGRDSRSEKVSLMSELLPEPRAARSAPPR